jgi:segregation and condensation protein B
MTADESKSLADEAATWVPPWSRPEGEQPAVQAAVPDRPVEPAAEHGPAEIDVEPARGSEADEEPEHPVILEVETPDEGADLPRSPLPQPDPAEVDASVEAEVGASVEVVAPAGDAEPPVDQPVGEVPADEAPADEVPAYEMPVGEAPAVEAPVGEVLVDEAVDEAPVGEASVDDVLADETPADEAPVDEVLVDEPPVAETPADEPPVDDVPVEAPVGEALADEAPADEMPVDEVLVDEASVGEVLVDEVLVDEAPVGEAADVESEADSDVEPVAEVDASGDDEPFASEPTVGVPEQREPTDAEPADARTASTEAVAVADEEPEATPLSDGELRGALEAILLVVEEPVTEVVLAQVLNQPTDRVLNMLDVLVDEYVQTSRGFELRRAAGGWRLYTRADFAPYVEKFVLDGQQVRLTQAALETLAVVAYKQPVTRSRISAIRGVNCDGVVRTLVARGLIEECGMEPESGAFLYRTTTLFLEKLGLNSVDQLPPLAPFLPDDVDAIADAQR